VEDGVHGRLRAGEAQHPVVPAATLTQAYSPGVHAQRRGEDDVGMGDRILTEARALRVGRSPRCANLQRVTRAVARPVPAQPRADRKSTRLNSSHVSISYAVFCLKKIKIMPAS